VGGVSARLDGNRRDRMGNSHAQMDLVVGLGMLLGTTGGSQKWFRSGVDKEGDVGEAWGGLQLGGVAVAVWYVRGGPPRLYRCRRCACGRG
jgi:hypothetical protein